MPSSKKDIGDRIRGARERHRWTQAALGERIGVDRKTVDNWENGRTSPRNRIGALEEVLGISLRGDDEQSAASEPVESEVAEAIRRDPRLMDSAREHLLNQYQMLTQLSDLLGTTEEEPRRPPPPVVEEALDLATRRAARRGKPDKS